MQAPSKKHFPPSNPKAVVPLILLLLVGLVTGGYFLLQALTGNGNELVVSGTIEVTEVHVGAEMGGRVDQVLVSEGDMVKSGSVVAVVGSDKVRASIDGVVLERLVEPGEVVMLGSSLVTLANLDDLTLTVYVPEDRYGQIVLGQACVVTVDSFPNQNFNGTVIHIADQAEYTPRNVQTTDSRKTTVFAIKLRLAPSAGLLKPGMPADVHFPSGQ
jgi:multidrug efflux pump subunit AcrA (membrane-fusion protein)